MGCIYSYYDETETYYPHLKCKLKTEGNCLYAKRCQDAKKFIPIDDTSWEECYLYNIEQRKNIPQGSVYIVTKRPSKNGNLYIYIDTDEDGSSEKILTDFKTIDQNYVYIKKSGSKYKVSLTPFPKKKKKDEELINDD